MELIEVKLAVNGQPIIKQVPTNLTLLRFLRDYLHLTGTKNGCSQGDCGCCTVLVEGKAEKSCLINMHRLTGKRVETIEGLAMEGSLHPIQQAFIDVGAIQCGFCTPGMILRAKALLDFHPKPSRQQIIEDMAPNLCRCTGYQGIIEAVERSAALIRGETPPAIIFPQSSSTGRVVGTVPWENELELKAAGKLVFADDIYPEQALWGRLLLTAHPHAKVVRLDPSAALETPGVKHVITHRDVPGPNVIGPGFSDRDQSVLAKEIVRYAGDVLALVLADDDETARRAARAIKVEYQEFPAIGSPQEALKPGSASLHPKGNLIKHIQYQRGDVAKGFEEADVVIEQDYQTQVLDHAFMEPEAGVAEPTPDGGIIVSCPNQMPFNAKRQIATNLGLPEDKVRVISTPGGGGFGGKSDLLLPVLLALGAFIAQRPVKITFTRSESLKMHTKRHAFWMHYKTAAYQDGRLAAIQAELISDAGPYSDKSPLVLEHATIFSCGPYVWPNVSLDSKTVRTNNANGGAFRGFGCNQVHFAIESQMDMMAHALGLDPLQFRLQNALEKGATTAIGEQLQVEVGIKETLRQAELILPTLAEARRQARPNKKIGIGLASGYKNVGVGIGMGTGFPDSGGAKLSLLPSGRVKLAASAVDMGQGTYTVFRQLVSEVCAIPCAAIDVIIADTGEVPDGAMVIGQRQTIIVGKAVVEAAKIFESKVLAMAGRMLARPAEQLILMEEGIRPSDENHGVSWAEIGQWAASQGEEIVCEYRHLAPRTFPVMYNNDVAPAVDQGGTEVKDVYRNFPAYSFITQIAVVEVDTDTGRVKVLKMVSIPDVGRVLNPRVLKGQLEGCAVMGVGYALSENYQQKDGVPQTRSLGSYGLPTFADAPEMQTIVVEIPEEDGPLGARAVSEGALVPTVPAITNAIYDAVGVRCTGLPTGPAIIKQLLANHS